MILSKNYHIHRQFTSAEMDTQLNIYAVNEHDTEIIMEMTAASFMRNVVAPCGMFYVLRRVGLVHYGS